MTGSDEVPRPVRNPAIGVGEGDGEKTAKSENGRTADRARSRVRSSHGLSRRMLLGAAAASSVTAFAGCFSESRSYRADPVGLTEDAASLGYASIDHQELDSSAEESLVVVDVDIEMISHVAGYGHESTPLSLLSTPEIEEGGQTLNPLTSLSIEEVLTEPALGNVMTDLLDDGNGSVEWQRGPESIGSESSTLLGEDATVELLAGITTDDVFVAVYGTKVTHDGDVVLAISTRAIGGVEDSSGELVGDDGIVDSATVEEDVDRFDRVLEYVSREYVEFDAVDDGDGDRTEDRTEGESLYRVPIQEVPVELHRHAAQHVEDEGKTGATPEWAEARLSGEVWAMYRPDVDGVAYYEFGVEPAGYVVVSAGDHDYPIPNWDFQSPPHGQRLERRARSEGTAPERLYKLDTLYYAAENEEGELVADYGNRLFKIEGLSEELFSEHERYEGKFRSEPTGPATDDERAETFEQETVVDEPGDDPGIEFVGWESWEELKAGYEASYGPLHEDLRRDAAEFWEAFRRVRERGQPIFPRERRIEPLLYEKPAFEVDGEGAELVSVERVERDGRQPAMAIHARADSGDAVPFTIEIRYENGESEVRDYAIVPRDGAAPATAASAGGPAEMVTTASADYWWATDKHDGQCWYHQHKVDGCYIGCGPVAWAILFGFGDIQAHAGNPEWTGRTGLFMKDGGTSGLSAVAPKLMRNNDGSRDAVENITEEIGEDLPVTQCFFWTEQTATYPWRMKNARDYFSGRTRTTLETEKSNIGKRRKKFRNHARKSIRDRSTPAIIGTGLLAHYPVAYGYKITKRTWWPDKHEFYINEGQGKGDEGSDFRCFTKAKTWFSGIIENPSA